MKALGAPVRLGCEYHSQHLQNVPHVETLLHETEALCLKERVQRMYHQQL